MDAPCPEQDYVDHQDNVGPNIAMGLHHAERHAAGAAARDRAERDRKLEARSGRNRRHQAA